MTYNGYNQAATIGGRTQGYNDLGNNLRVQTAPGVNLVNSTAGVIARRTSAGITYYTRTPDGKLLGEFGASGTYDYVTDQQNTVRTLMNDNGGLAGQYTYSPYGTATIAQDDTSNAAANNPGATSPATRALNGDNYLKLGARYYDGRGHFTQTDPKAGSRLANHFRQ